MIINNRYGLIKVNFLPIAELLTYIMVNELCFPLGCPLAAETECNTLKF